jgi:sulfate adenylyltransferase subunit 1
VHFIPISALEGDNVVNKSDNMSWYDGPALMEFLESIEIASDRNFSDFRLPVQYVNRPNLNFRGFCGTITAGVICKDDDVMVLPSRKSSKVKNIVTYEGNLEFAFAGQAVTLTLEDEIDISRGDIIVRAGCPASVTNHLKAHLIWMNESELNTSRGYLFKFASKLTPGHIANIDYQIDVNTQTLHPANSLGLNAIGVVDLHMSQPIVAEPYALRTGTGAFVVIDRITNLTVGAGMVIQPLKITEDKIIAGEDSIQAELNHLLAEGLDAKAFEKKLNAIIRKHYPHWQAKDI